MITFFHATQILSGAFLILLVLLHSPKGEGLTAIGGASQLFSSQKGAEAGLNRFTGWVAIIFIVVSLLLGFGVVK